MSITLNKLTDKQYEKARALTPHVRVNSQGEFSVASTTHAGVTYAVRVDDATNPTTIICPCKAGELSKPCYHAARVLDVLFTLAQMNVDFTADFFSQPQPNNTGALQTLERAVSAACDALHADYTDYDEQFASARALYLAFESLNAQRSIS